MKKNAINIAKEHAKTQGLGRFYVDVNDINKLVLEAVQKREMTVDNILLLRDNVSALMGKLVTLETELDKLDEDSPCLKCKKIGGLV